MRLSSRLRAAVEPLYSALSPAIDKPHFGKLSEEYFVLQLAPGPPLPEPAAIASRHVSQQPIAPEFLEILIIALILFEIVMAFVRG